MKRFDPDVVALLATVVGVACVTFTARTVIVSAVELDAGTQAGAEGRLDAAIIRLRRSASHYVPLFPYGQRAIGALRELSARAEAAGQRAIALRGCRAMRGSANAARSLWTPYDVESAFANDCIARLGPVVDPDPARSFQGQRPKESDALRTVLDAPLRPRMLFAVPGVLGFLAAAGLLLKRAQGHGEERVVRWSRAEVVTLLFALAAFVAGMLGA